MRELFHNGHYNVIAKRIRELRHVHSPTETSGLAYDAQCAVIQDVIDELVIDLADWFEKDNPRFERDTWMEATNTNAS